MAAVLSESVLDQNGPKWSKRPFWSKRPYSELDLAFARTKWTILIHLGPSWPEEVNFGPFRSANRTLAIPEFLNSGTENETIGGEKKPINAKHIMKHFSGGPCGTIVPPPPVPGTNGTKWRFYCGIEQETASLSQARAPIYPRDGPEVLRSWSPCPSFPCFFGKRPGKRSKKQGFFISTEPLKSLEKKAKSLKTKSKEILAGEKNKEFQKKTRKGRSWSTLAQFFANAPSHRKLRWGLPCNSPLRLLRQHPIEPIRVYLKPAKPLGFVNRGFQTLVRDCRLSGG